MAISTAAPTFGPAKIFIAKDEHEWVPLGEVANGPLCRDEQNLEMTFSSRSVSLSFTMKKRDRIRLLQYFNILDKPKCTYKTIRRECAKRNRR